MKANKTNEINRYAKVDFTSLLPLMAGVWKKETGLMQAFLAKWNAQKDKSAPLEFREVFTTFALANGYCPQWAGTIARDADRKLFGIRAERSDKGKPKANKPKANKPKANMPRVKVTPNLLANMAKELDDKGIKTLIGLLAAM